MKKQEFNKMTEEELCEFFCETSHEIADLARMLVDIQRDINEKAGALHELDLEFEAREGKELKEENRLN